MDEEAPGAGTSNPSSTTVVALGLAMLRGFLWAQKLQRGLGAGGPHLPVTVLLPCSSWVPVEGTRDICSCCETGNCEPPALSRRLNPMERWPGRRFRRDAPEGKALVRVGRCGLG